MSKRAPVLKENIIRKKITLLLIEPKTVTELKKELPEFSSLGTLAYHLKILRDSGKIGTYKAKHKQGSPTYYYSKTIKNVALFQYNPLELAEKETSTREEWKAEILKFLSKNKEPALEGELMSVIMDYEHIGDEAFVESSVGYNDIFYEVLQDLSTEGLLGYGITKEGKEYLLKANEKS